jgi:2-oxo-4-hydroxy-4-carboxy-5-ureidoimidazoline decarboxylase
MGAKTVTVERLSSISQDEFVAALDGVYEHSPWVAAAAWRERPFKSVEEVHRACRAAIRRADREMRLALIQAHPELAGKATIRGELTPDSTWEQSGAGLDRCSPEEFRRLTELNRAYAEKFGFPLIIAVRGHTRVSVIGSIAERLQHALEEEFEEALRQIDQIALFRLQDRLSEGDASGAGE